jgi:hypothetical protein
VKNPVRVVELFWPLHHFLVGEGAIACPPTASLTTTRSERARVRYAKVRVLRTGRTAAPTSAVDYPAWVGWILRGTEFRL